VAEASFPWIGINVRAATDGDVDAGAEREHIDQNDDIDVRPERRDAGRPPLATQRVRILIKPHGVCRKSVLPSNAWAKPQRSHLRVMAEPSQINKSLVGFSAR
jgi:hypothetical protein